MEWISTQFSEWSLKDRIEVAAHAITILGLFWAIFIYRRELLKQREEREVGTYSTLDDKYLHFLELCLQYPQLNMYQVPVETTKTYTPDETIQRYALFETMISIMERAYLRYYDHPEESRQRQWPGWQAYLSDWKRHPDWEEMWRLLGNQYDTSFIDYVDNLPASPLPRTIPASAKA